jgi:Cu/Zn superoxide dismutase
MIVMTNRFSVNPVLGRTVVVPANRDDFTSQPAGDSGAKIAVSYKYSYSGKAIFERGLYYE